MYRLTPFALLLVVLIVPVLVVPGPGSGGVGAGGAGAGGGGAGAGAGSAGVRGVGLGGAGLGGAGLGGAGVGGAGVGGAPGGRVPSIVAVWPTEAPHAVLRPFEAPATRYSAGHRGIDIAATPGQPVYAIAAGTVSFAGTVVDRPVVSVVHADSLVSAVEPVTPSVVAGQTVAAGDQIGVVASSTHCELGCVHLGLRLRGDYVSPLLLLGGIPRAVLLPSTPAEAWRALPPSVLLPLHPG
ncbi:M23 family metallopeptidase [Subtercola boreus]|uniref:M23ase beta-sheet core domain-containing protein n=1 Tax=Subtercola boreus TaxID=120213 RepID=A0A3E0WE78_9MICO|nr:M23 family metallopeptidase [Subtercola boreus]RFA22149.1 hypothetical protein B7R24_04920 [Subtercola boreus]RFA22329.1 hypothetical protein B7R23_04865 [Subtercola boreus]RFA28192.1 hypothetical protein B7R25_04990 [Subtercola boreus]